MADKNLISSLFNICTLLYQLEGVNPQGLRKFQILQQHLINVSKQGSNTLVIYSKELRLCLYRYLAGKPIKVSTVRIALHKDGLPKILSGFRSSISESNASILRCLTTTLSFSRAITGDGLRIDTTSITNDGSCGSIEGLVEFISNFDVSFGVDSYYTSCEWKKYHYSTKSGPNGLALASSLIDLSILSTRYEPLLEHIIVASGVDEFREKVDSIKPLALHKHSEEYATKGIIRKLAIVPDKENKNRVVAIMDYWSQTVLKPYHEALMKVLSKIEQDRTFNQSPVGIDFIDGYFSYDLSNATDRFPLSVQKEVIRKFVGDDRAESWAYILSHEPFNLKDEQLYYKVGQPLGAYSSWAAFALTHHLLIRYCIELAGETNTNCYMVLGDDVVISSSKVAKHYVSILELLGVELSKKKTLVSNDTYEFAKRIFHKGIEISPFPILDVIENKSKPESLGYVFYNARRKGWLLSKSYHGVPDLELFRQILKYMGYGSRSIERCLHSTYFSFLINFLHDNFTFEEGGYFLEEDIVSSSVLGLLQQLSCNKSPRLFIKEHLYPFIQELKVDKLRKAFRICSQLNSEADVMFAALTVSLPDEVTDQVSVYDIQNSWPIACVLHDASVKLSDAIAESHMGEISSPKLILALGEDIVLPDINKYSSLRKHDIHIAASSSLYRTVFKQWTRGDI